MIVATGAARVYSGVHWPSDVLGGYLFGLIALAPLFFLRIWLSSERTEDTGSVGVCDAELRPLVSEDHPRIYREDELPKRWLEEVSHRHLPLTVGPCES